VAGRWGDRDQQATDDWDQRATTRVAPTIHRVCMWNMSSIVGATLVVARPSYLSRRGNFYGTVVLFIAPWKFLYSIISMLKMG